MNKSFFRFLRWSYLYHLLPKPTEPVSRCLQKYLEKGDVVFDLGGNCGNTALEMAGIVGSKGLVFSFEPNPAKFEECRTIEQKNLFQNIHFSNFGIGAENTALPFFIDTREGSQASTFDTLNLQAEKLLVGYDFFTETSAQIRRLDDIDLPPPKLIKLDIEGYELEALNGGLETIKKHRPIVIFEFFFNDNDPDISKRKQEMILFFSNLNYKTDIFHIFSGDVVSSTVDTSDSLITGHFDQHTGCDIVAIPQNRA